MDVFSVEFDVPRLKTVARIRMCGAAPGQFAAVLWMRNASLSRPEKSSISASANGNFAYPLAPKQMRRLFGPCGGAGRHDVLVAADLDVSSGKGADNEAWVAYRKATKQGRKKRREDCHERESKNKEDGDGQPFDGFN